MERRKNVGSWRLQSSGRVLSDETVIILPELCLLLGVGCMKRKRGVGARAWDVRRCALGSDEDCEAAYFLVEVDRFLNFKGDSFRLARRDFSEFTVHVEDSVERRHSIDL